MPDFEEIANLMLYGDWYWSVQTWKPWRFQSDIINLAVSHLHRKLLIDVKDVYVILSWDDGAGAAGLWRASFIKKLSDSYPSACHIAYRLVSREILNLAKSNN